MNEQIKNNGGMNEWKAFNSDGHEKYSKNILLFPKSPFNYFPFSKNP